MATKRAKTYEKMTKLWNKTKALKEERMGFMKKKVEGMVHKYFDRIITR